MRQIKFRAWNADAHKMIKPVGVLQDNDYTSAIYQDLPISFTKKRVLFHPTKIDSISLMQYTGICDKNDKEIYEGDILKVYIPERESEEPHFTDDVYYENTTIMTSKEIIGEVRMSTITGTKLLVRNVIENKPKHKKDKKFIENGIHKGSHLKIKNDDEIIGNIYENPELSENK